MNKHHLESMKNYYYGNSELEEIGFNELKKLYENNKLKRIYGVYENDEYNAWYLIIPKKGKSKIVPIKKGEINGYKIIYPFKSKVQFYHIRPDLIKKFSRGITTLFYKNSEINQNESINCKDYLEKIKYPYCYAKSGDSYLTFVQYRDIYIVNKVNSQEEAILTLLSATDYEEDIVGCNLLNFVVDNRNYNKEQRKDGMIL